MLFLPNQSIKISEIAEILALVQDGQSMTSLQVLELFPSSRAIYATREQVAEVLVRKFLPTFGEGLTLQGRNVIYFELLLEKLR